MYARKALFKAFTAVLLILSFSLMTGLITAQPSGADEWRYGYRDVSDESAEDLYDLVAYTLTGEVVPVVEGISSSPIVFDLGEDHVLAFIEEDGADAWYEIIGTEATSIDPGDSDSDDLYASALISYRAPYVLLATGRMGDPLVIIDLENHTAQRTDQGALYNLTNCCVLTDQGTVQYYARVASDAGRQDALIERDLKSGEEQFLFIDENLSTGYVNQSGDQWLLFVNHPDTRERTTIVWQDGEAISQTTAPLAIRMMWIEDALLTNDALCERNCEFTLQPRDGDTLTFSASYPNAGEGWGRMYFPHRFSPDGGLLGQLIDPNQIVKLTTDGRFKVFGDFNNVALTSSGTAMISNDGRFAAVMPDPDEGGFAVIDTETGEAVIRSDPENVPNFTNVYYLSEGVLVVSYLSREQITYFYRPSDQQLFKMALPNGLSFVDVVDDETLLYFGREDGTGPIVIGLYTLETGEMQPVTEEVFPLPRRLAIRP